MTKKHSTKRALIASILALCMCFTMLIGTTFAWFTDSVTSSGNVIQTGKLDVAMYWVEGDEDPATVADDAWNDASTGAIFNNDKWEPGYAEAKHIKIANEGTLALKYQMRIIANGVVSELANVIDVYYFDEAQQLTRDSFVEANKLGTLAEVLNVAYANNISKTISGSLEKDTSKTVTLAFKMQESAGNEYQDMSIGADFSIQLLATQYTFEEDSFNNQYDADADYAPQDIPAAMVYALPQSKLQTITIGGFGGATLDTGYSFQPTETFEQASAGDYEWAHADFFVYADATVPANSMALAGYYTAFDGFSWGGNVCSETSWIGLSADVDIAAGEENGIRLLGDGMGLPGISYSEICNYGNDGTGFLCGATDLTGANEGTTLYVELRVYKVGACGNTSEGHHHNDISCETGEYITIGTFQYTFDDPAVEYLADGSRVRYGEAGEVILEGVDKVVVTDGTYYIPDGVTTLDGYLLSQNAEITTVVIPDTITDFGATGVSATNASSGAFKDSAVETVVLPEGMTTIPAAAFNGAKNLKSVNIPASVETIGVNAFRQTAIETLTIPETVETIEYGAFRDMTSLTTVTIEGDVHIPDYAFRGCTNLRTVYINGENATVGSNMAFCNASSNNPNTNNLTFYVKNASVASQVKTCMGVGSNYYIYVGDTLVYSYVGNAAEVNKLKTVKNLTELQTAIDSAVAGDIILLGADITGDVTIDTGVATIIDGANYKYVGTIKIGVGETVTIKNVNFVHEGATAYDFIKNEGSPTGKNYNSNLLVENCTFVGDGNDGTVAVRTIHPTHVQIENCVGEKLHSFMQNTGGQKVTVNELTVTDSKSGVSLGSVKAATVSNSNFTVGEGYGIRIDAATANSAFVIDTCNISAYIPVVVRKTTADNVSVTFNGESTMTETNTEGLWCAVANNEYGDVVKADLTAGTYAVDITVNDAGLDQAGLYVKN